MQSLRGSTRSNANAAKQGKTVKPFWKMTAEVNQHRRRLYLVMGSQHTPVRDEVKRTANSGTG